MKTLLKLTTGVVLMVLAAACQKEKASTAVETPKEKVSLTELVQKMYAPSDPSGYAAINAAYASLNAEELQQFEEIRLKNDSVQLTKKAAEASNGRISASQETQI